MPALRLASFSHHSVTLEARFDTAFLMWDRSGEVSRDLARLSTGVKLVNAQPASIVLSVKDKYDVGYSLGNLSITQYFPERDPTEFKDEAEKLAKAVTEHFDIREFTRLGFRMLFSKDYVSEEAATTDFLAAEILKVPAGNPFSIAGRASLPEYVVQWKGETHVVIVRVKVQTDKVEFAPPRSVKDIEHISREQSRIYVDVDYATMGVTPVGGFRAATFVDEARHLINRDVHHFLGD
jgi:hypothetical protein